MENSVFKSNDEYIENLFAIADRQLSNYLSVMRASLSQDGGAVKNVLYPDIDTAYEICTAQLIGFGVRKVAESVSSGGGTQGTAGSDELNKLFADFAGESQDTGMSGESADVLTMLRNIQSHAELTDLSTTALPLYSLSQKYSFTPFSLFCFIFSLLSATRSDYSIVFQVINRSSQLNTPSFETVARVFFGDGYLLGTAAQEISRSREQLEPFLEFEQGEASPFGTVPATSKRMTDFIFASHTPTQRSQNHASFQNIEYSRFYKLFTDNEPLNLPVLNQNIAHELIASHDLGVRIFSLYGEHGSGRKFAIMHFCLAKSLNCLHVDCGKLFTYDLQLIERVLRSVVRESLLTDCVCILGNLKYSDDTRERFFDYLSHFAQKLLNRKITVFTVGHKSLPISEISSFEISEHEVPSPSARQREQLWVHYSKQYTFSSDVDFSEMALKFLFTPGKIISSLKTADSYRAIRGYANIIRTCLFDACNSKLSHELTSKAKKITTAFTWDDIVLPPDQKHTLQYACYHMLYRRQVYDDWDYNRKYPYGRGLSVLLYGSPGTGKTMCAGVLANALDLELYRIDLSQVIDKYIGETEKSISMIFREAKKCNVVLFFDECDTLFSKRTDDGGNMQSLNNNISALLLQEIEDYDGISVLATNNKNIIDPAFFRRMKFVIEFQFPDAKTRHLLWETTIPKATPLSDDVDLRFLAERFEFAGGNIKNCILNAAFIAAGDRDSGGEVLMKHYLLAVRQELIKTGRVFTRSDFEPYADVIL